MPTSTKVSRLLLLSFIIAAAIVPVQRALAQLTDPTELQAICALAASISRPKDVSTPQEWTCTGNVPTDDPCSLWFGISCSSDARGTYVSGIQLLDESITGTIPTQIGLFRGLQTLDLGSNSLTGTVPNSFGNLTTLQFLGLDYNHLSGTFPAGLSNLTLLSSLYLAANTFTGCLPDISSLVNLNAPVLNVTSQRYDYSCTISIAPLPGDPDNRQFTCPSVSNGCPQSPANLNLFVYPGAKCIFDCDCTWSTWSSFGACARNSTTCTGTAQRNRTVDQYLLGCPIISVVGLPPVGYPCDLTCPGASVDVNSTVCATAFNGGPCQVGSLSGTCQGPTCTAVPLRAGDEQALCALAAAITTPDRKSVV